ncbi:MAG TPA: Na+/H+ antiporter NhaA [Steroidobacteraceae bacterium]|jgi:NhaA family Na+:H+ antiporter|nr:Na+/H+ antiporter NhaA [Steroidobacteraceae bacterium]
MNLTDTFARFAKSEQFGGVLLLACTIVSLALANSPAGDPWLGVWQTRLGPLSLEHWINDALMAIFFLLIGLELERELYVGELSSVRNALLPAFAAVGGMIAPALFHFALNGGSATQPGFGIPMATDIAFALGVLALLGKRVPPALKVFIVAFAVIDDLGAIVLIAVVYTAHVAVVWVALALGVWAALIVLNRLRITTLVPYLAGGAFMWVCLLNAGVHASIAGVMLAFAIPFTARAPGAESPSHRLEHWLHKPVAFLILPLFALANTGVPIDADAIAQLQGTNSLGIALGLLLGKPLGVLLMCVLAVASGVSALPVGNRWTHIVGAGLLGGIGFTMSIFITNLAFANAPALINSSKLAVLIASLVAGVLGFLWLRVMPEKGTFLFFSRRKK